MVNLASNWNLVPKRIKNTKFKNIIINQSFLNSGHMMSIPSLSAVCIVVDLRSDYSG